MSRKKKAPLPMAEVIEFRPRLVEKMLTKVRTEAGIDEKHHELIKQTYDYFINDTKELIAKQAKGIKGKDKAQKDLDALPIHFLEEPFLAYLSAILYNPRSNYTN